MEKAIELHFAGEYAASVPILMSQIDGLTRDLVGQTFFQNVTAKNQENFIDDESLAGMPGNLVEVRRVFSTPSYETTRSGSISRHGVMHGRELDYDTLENSTKCIVLLAALAEYLPPFADTKGFEALDVHSSTAAGLLGVDDEGRLLDDRDVREFQGFAFYLDIAYMNAQLTPTLHTFDLDYQVRSLAAKHRLDRKQIFYFHDAAGWWLFYKLPSGHFLVLAERPNTSTESRNPDAWRWDAHEDPSVAPWHNARGWQSDDVYPRTSNWEPLQIGT
ncbi:hypothetical protein [Specibacter sp. NPDC078692]|uniref:hypothetical protein n=1 Tax=Specibacter sp. NPDC078692 TaxID=3155818 RepID=UPI0034208780